MKKKGKEALRSGSVAQADGMDGPDSLCLKESGLLPGEAFISIEKISLGYQSVLVLKDFSYRFQKGKRYAILGPSGCGKSSLFNALIGVLPPLQGTIQIEERAAVLGREKTGIILQDFGLLPWKTVKQNIRLAANNLSKESREKKVIDLLRIFDLQGLENRFPAQLSGGQRQRVAIARTMMKERDLLLLDEPFSALDSISKQDLQATLYRAYLEHRFTLIIITHDVEEAVLFGEEILLFEGKHPGRLSASIQNEAPYSMENGKTENFYKTCERIKWLLKNV